MQSGHSYYNCLWDHSTIERRKDVQIHKYNYQYSSAGGLLPDFQTI